MSRSPEKQARAEAMLGELAELGLMVAKELAVRVRESEDVDQTVALAGAFQKVSRVVRLTLALDFKLERDAAREAQAEAQQAEAEAAQLRQAEAVRAPPPVPNATEVRKTRVSNLLTQLLWNESEGDSEEFDILLEDLSARLDEAARSPDFETTPIETLARRIAADMGVSGEFVLSLCETTSPEGGEAAEPSLADTG
jgi:D-serine deaminase-like pyridoxal phosphate-dependent protein